MSCVRVAAEYGSMVREPILHVDMDAFFVEVERLANPSLVGVPVLVGGISGRSVVAAASYEARRHGVRSAMPMGVARSRCPMAVVVPPDHSKYRAASRHVFEILRSFTPRVEGISIDEGFLDVSGLRLHYDDGAQVGAAIRDRLATEAQLPASVGVATTKLIAKLASEAAKPNGLLVVPAGHELEFLHPLPVRALWGVGEATYASLETLGVASVGDLAALPKPAAVRRLGESVGSHLWELAWARDPRPVTPGEGAKSISVEETYEHDLSGATDVDEEMFRHCDRLARRLRQAQVAARTVSLKVRFSDFETIVRSHTVEAPIDTTKDLVAAIRQLVDRASLGVRPIRLLGVGGSNLTEPAAPRQLHLDGEVKEALAVASDRIRDRFGEDAIKTVRLMRPRQPRPRVS